MIGDRMVTDIIHTETGSCRLTDLNPNAFYELGIRHSTELPTIHLAKTGTNLPFDNVAHRTIFVDLTEWRSIENARTQLAASVKAIKAPNYRVSNPITQANTSFKMPESADPRDRLFADLQERLISIEARLTERRIEILKTSNTPTGFARKIAALLQTVTELEKVGLPEDKIVEQLAKAAEELGLPTGKEKIDDGWLIRLPYALLTVKEGKPITFSFREP